MREYILSPRIGYSVEDAIENTSEENAVIEVYEYGVWKGSYPVTPLSMQIFKPQPHPRYMRQQRIVLREGEKVLKKPIPEDYLTTDVNPFFQIIQKIVSQHEEMTLEDIARSLIHDMRMFKETKEDLYIIKQLVNKMNEDGLLLKWKEKYRVGVKIEMGDRLTPLVRGYDPFIWEIMDLIERKGLVSLDEIHRKIITGLKWTKRISLVDNYLARLEAEGCIDRVGDYYRYIKRPEEITGEVKKKKI